ncbi:MAG: hypothetical protein GC180_13145 [Bacteroidetes bacterium]|nr:hypothetical protein [Bacteroidota bacterium]
MTQHKHQNDELDLDKKLGEELGRAEHFVHQNKKTLSIVIGGLIVVIGGYVGFKQFIVAPQEKEAQEALFIVQQQFEKDSFNQVVNGNGTDLSAVEIVDEYGMTKAGNLAAFMAGVSYLRLGQFEEAYDYLNDFSSDDDILGPFAIGLKGDALVEQGDNEGGVKLYMTAADASENELITPFFLQKAGITYTVMGEYAKAEEAFKRIKTDFGSAPEGMDIDKYIELAAIQANK